MSNFQMQIVQCQKMAHYLGTPSDATNACNVSSQIPRSAKYSSVENRTTQVTVKKNKADRASPDLLKAIIITSIVMTIVLEYLYDLNKRRSRNSLRMVNLNS